MVKTRTEGPFHNFSGDSVGYLNAEGLPCTGPRPLDKEKAGAPSTSFYKHCRGF